MWRVLYEGPGVGRSFIRESARPAARTRTTFTFILTRLSSVTLQAVFLCPQCSPASDRSALEPSYSGRTLSVACVVGLARPGLGPAIAGPLERWRSCSRRPGYLRERPPTRALSPAPRKTKNLEPDAAGTSAPAEVRPRRGGYLDRSNELVRRP